MYVFVGLRIAVDLIYEYEETHVIRLMITD